MAESFTRGQRAASSSRCARFILLIPLKAVEGPASLRLHPCGLSTSQGPGGMPPLLPPGPFDWGRNAYGGSVQLLRAAPCASNGRLRLPGGVLHNVLSVRATLRVPKPFRPKSTPQRQGAPRRPFSHVALPASHADSCRVLTFSAVQGGLGRGQRRPLTVALPAGWLPCFFLPVQAGGFSPLRAAPVLVGVLMHPEEPAVLGGSGQWDRCVKHRGPNTLRCCGPKRARDFDIRADVDGTRAPFWQARSNRRGQPLRTAMLEDGGRIAGRSITGGI